MPAKHSVKAQCRAATARRSSYTATRAVRDRSRLHTKEVFKLEYGCEVGAVGPRAGAARARGEDPPPTLSFSCWDSHR